jgi:protoporphyrinogen oxidase
VIVPSDERMIALAEELGLADELSFSPVGVGFFVDGRMYPFNGIGDFLRFPPLSPPARARLAWFVAQCQLRRNYEPLEDVPLLSWLARHCGRKVVQRIWRPLLDSRFDSSYDELPATYLWARTNRMRSARQGGGTETMGCLKGGHERLVEAVAARARSLGVEIRLGAGVEGLAFDPELGVTGVRVDGEDERFDLTIATLQPPALARLLPESLHGVLDAYPKRFLGVVCLVLKVRHSVLPYYSVNICDPTPITTVVETSHVVGTEHTDGLRLLYLPKYCEATSPLFSEDDASIYARFTSMLERLAPGEFRHEDVVDWTVQRAPLVEPVHARGHTPRIAPVWPEVPGLALASASQVYPRLLNGESIVGMAERVAGEVSARLGAGGEVSARPAAAVGA